MHGIHCYSMTRGKVFQRILIIVNSCVTNVVAAG